MVTLITNYDIMWNNKPVLFIPKEVCILDNVCCTHNECSEF